MNDYDDAESRYDGRATVRDARSVQDDITANFHGGNAQSLEAHESVAKRKASLGARVVSYVTSCGERGATTDEVETALHLTHQTASARMTEAKVRNLLQPSGELRRTRQGCRAAVLIAVPYERD